MAIIMSKGCLEAIYGLMGWKGLRRIEYCSIAENRRSYIELEQQFNIENLGIRRNRNLLYQMYDQSKMEINVTLELSDRILRSTKKVKMKYTFSNLTKLHNSPYYRGVKLWNSLPVHIQKCSLKSEFKKLLQNYQKI